MKDSPYSYNELLAIIDLCVGLERHIRLEPDAAHIRILGIAVTRKILEMNHAERLSFIKEVVQYL